MKKDWEIKELNDVCNVEYGTRVVNKRDGGSKYYVYGGGGATFKMDTYNREDRLVISRFAMSQQCTRFVKGKFFLNDSGLTISAIDSSSILSTFLDWQLFSMNDKIYALARGSAQKNLDVPAFRKLLLVIPPLDEQKRIVEILDEKFEKFEELKRVTEHQIAYAKELFESQLSQTFANHTDDWVEAKLSQLGFFGRGKSKHRPRNDKSLYGGEYPFVQTGDIRNAPFVINTYTQTYNEKGLQQSKLWQKGTLCITIAANIAETSILGMDACFPDSVIGFVPKNGNSAFYQYLMMFNKIELQKMGKGSAQDNINLGTFESMTFMIPPDKKQRQIVKELNDLSEKTKELEAIFRRKIADLEELKKSYLEQAFSGNL